MPKFASACQLALALVYFVPSVAWADNWPTWRGPHQNGICDETNLPTKWSSDDNVAWKLPLPGPAGATPVVWNDQIFVSTVDSDQLLLLAIGTDGKERWRQQVGQGNKDVRGDEGNSASPSPVTDGQHVWVMMGNGQMACYTLAGKQVWALDLAERYGPFKIQFGMSSTPVLYQDRILLQFIHGDGQAETHEASVAAIDKLTGKEIWRTGRVTGASQENEHSYASPILYDDGTQHYLVTHGADYVVAYDTQDGRELWRCGGLNPRNDPKRDYHPTLRFVASPAAADGLIVVPTAKNGPVFALRPGFRGDITRNPKAHVWTLPDNTPDVPSPVIHNGLVYLCRENGNLICLEAQSGEVIYQERTHRDRHRASPVLGDGKLYLTARDGKVTVVQTGREFKILSQNDLGESISASPAISNGTIYLRTFDSLWAIRNK